MSGDGKHFEKSGKYLREFRPGIRGRKMGSARIILTWWAPELVPIFRAPKLGPRQASFLAGGRALFFWPGGEANNHVEGQLFLSTTRMITTNQTTTTTTTTRIETIVDTHLTSRIVKSGLLTVAYTLLL